MSKAQIIGFLNTPPIWKKRQFDIDQFEFPSLKLETFQSAEIPNNLRLGHQMEYVFKQLIEYSEDYKLVLYNLPIRDEKRTLGEIDFILKNKKTNQFIHVELTYKFYLLDPEIPDPIHSLIGPNRRDRFFDKMEKIKNEQFSLLHSTAGINALADHKIDHLKIKHQCCFKAQVFVPYHQKNRNLGVLNKAVMAGYWLRLKDFITTDFIKDQFYIPRKSDWVIAPQEQVSWKSHNEILLEIQSKLKEKRAPMIWRKNARKEFEKCFIVWW